MAHRPSRARLPTQHAISTPELTLGYSGREALCCAYMGNPRRPLSCGVARGPALWTAARERQAPCISGLSALGIRLNSLPVDYPPADFIDGDLHPVFG